MRVAVQRLDRRAQGAERGVQVLDPVQELGRGLRGRVASSAASFISSASASVTPERTGSEPLKLRSASWQSAQGVAGGDRVDRLAVGST